MAPREQRRVPHSEDQQQSENGHVQGDPIIGLGGVRAELVSGRELVQVGEDDAGVHGEVHGVPGLVGQPPPHDHKRDGHDREHDGGPNGRGDHAGVAAQQPRDLDRDADLVGARVADRDEHDVSYHERDARHAVAPMPDGQNVEADKPLERRKPAEQEDLQQREVHGE